MKRRRPTNPKLVERDQAIIRKVKSGTPLREASRIFGIHYERVRQIIWRKMNYRKFMKKKKEMKMEEGLRKLEQKTRSAGLIPSRKQIQQLLGSRVNTTPYVKKLMNKGYVKQRTYRISDEELLNYLSKLSKRLNKTPSNFDIMHDGKYSNTLFHYHFGSLSKAQKLAGLKPNKRGGQKGQRKRRYR